MITGIKVLKHQCSETVFYLPSAYSLRVNPSNHSATFTDFECYKFLFINKGKVLWRSHFYFRGFKFYEKYNYLKKVLINIPYNVQYKISDV